MNAPEHVAPPPNATAVALLPIAEIMASRSNPRKHFDDAYIAELADSIKSHGLIQPITVRPLSLDGLFAFNKRAHPDDERPTYEIVVGECRWRAAKLAGLPEIPAFWRELDDKQVLEIQVIENLQRRDVHEIEEAEGYQALIARHGYTADQIAGKIGKSRSYVYGRLKYTALCREVREAFFAGKLDGSTALLIARIPGEALQKRAAKEVASGYNGEPLSYRAAKQHIHSRYTLSLKQATFRPDDATLVPTAGACSACPKLSGNFQDLFNDIDAADVCTDPDCYEAKRLARREQLIAHAEKRKIPVFLGDKGREAINAEIEYVSLDAEVDDDAEGRTYRQILGDKAPVTALIEFPYGRRDLTECAPLNTLEAALRKAGWKPAEPEPTPARKGETPEEAEARKAAHAANQAREARREELRLKAMEETERRTSALAACWPALYGVDLATPQRTVHDLFYLVAEGWLRLQVGYTGLEEYEDLIRRHLDSGYALPDEFDSAPQLDRAIALLRAAPLGRVMAMMLDEAATEERRVHGHNLEEDRIADSAPHLIAQLTRRLGAPFASLTHPASTPTEAAPAADKCAKAAPAAEKPAKKPTAKKAKADPAPASPANEAAAPPKTTERPAWPFPIGART